MFRHLIHASRSILFFHRNDLYLQPGQQVSLRFAFGYVPQVIGIFPSSYLTSS